MKTLEIDPVQAETVRLIFRLAREDSAVYPMIVQMERAARFGDAPGEKPANRARCAARGSARVTVGQHRPIA
jgi:hypothetical protein